MEWDKSLNVKLDLFNPEFKMQISISYLFFIAYSIINIIDMNEFIINLNVNKVEDSTRWSLIYAYIFGYYSYIMKMFLGLITLLIIITLIRILVITIFCSVVEKNTEKIGTIIESGIMENIRLLLGFMINPIFLIMFLFVIPVFIFVFLIPLTSFYNTPIIKKEDNLKQDYIMKTNHNLTMLLIVFIMIISSIFCYYMWFVASAEEGPSLPSKGEVPAPVV